MTCIDEEEEAGVEREEEEQSRQLLLQNSIMNTAQEACCRCAALVVKTVQRRESLTQRRKGPLSGSGNIKGRDQILLVSFLLFQRRVLPTCIATCIAQ